MSAGFDVHGREKRFGMERNMSTQVIVVQLSPGEGTSRHLGIVIELSSSNDILTDSLMDLEDSKGLYVYRFEVPIGEVYRFCLSWKQGPSKTPSKTTSDLGKFVDYAFSRVADDAICSKHLRQEDAIEVHLGEADYIALLRNGQCACAAAVESGDVSAGDVCRRPPRRHSDDKSRGGGEVESRGDAGESVGNCIGKGKSDADIKDGCETERLRDLTALFDENDVGCLNLPADSTGDQATWSSRGDVLATAAPRATASFTSKPDSAGRPSQEQVNCRIAYSESASSGFRPEVPETSVSDLSETGSGFTPDESSRTQSDRSASSSTSSSDDDSPEDANRAEDRDEGPTMTGEDRGGPDGDVWKTCTLEKCHRAWIRAKDAVNLLFAIVGDERTYIISSANERLTSALISSPHSLSTDLISDLMRLISHYESFRLAGRDEVGDQTTRSTTPRQTDEDMDTIGDTVEYDEDYVPELSYPDQPDSFLDQYFTENDYLPIDFPYESSLKSRDCSGDAATPVDPTIGFDEIILDSDGSSLTAAAAAVTDVSGVPTTTTWPDLASGSRQRSLLIADVPGPASTEPRRRAVMWSRARRAMGRLLRSVRGFFRLRFRFGRRRRSTPAALRLALRSRDYQAGGGGGFGGFGDREMSLWSTSMELCEDITPDLPYPPPPPVSARSSDRV